MSADDAVRARIRALAEALEGRAILRVDANQGYDVAQSLAFVAAVDLIPAG